jgi:hypothetical protein
MVASPGADSAGHVSFQHYYPDAVSPVLDTFLRGLPYTYRCDCAGGYCDPGEVSGECGGQWCLVKSDAGWIFADELPLAIAAHIVIPEAIAWRLFTKGISRDTAYPQVTVRGDATLAGHVLELVAIVG